MQNYSPVSPAQPISATSWETTTFDLVGTIIENDMKDIIDRTIGIQQVGVAMVAHKTVSPPKNQNGPVDQLENKLLVLPCGQTRGAQ